MKCLTFFTSPIHFILYLILAKITSEIEQLVINTLLNLPVILLFSQCYLHSFYSLGVSKNKKLSKRLKTWINCTKLHSKNSLEKCHNFFLV